MDQITIPNYSFLPLNLNELLIKVDSFCKGETDESKVINYLKKYFPDDNLTIKRVVYRVINRINSF